MNTAGFYNKEFMIRAGSFVYGPGYELHIEEKDQYAYPVAGWYWFDNADAAAAYFDVPVEDFNLDLPPVAE